MPRTPQPTRSSARTPLRAQPRRRAWARWSLIAPLGVAVIIAALLIASAGRALAPATPVRVTQAVFDRAAPNAPAPRAPAPTPGDDRPMERGSRHSAGSGGGAVQAPGWLEADPFLIACTALSDGVLAEMLVLEGDRVEQGQLVARLVTDDAELALARAEADLAASEASLRVARAEREAAETDWDNPIERERAVATTEAALAETQAELDQLPALVAAEEAVLARMEEEARRTRSAFGSGAANEIELIIFEKRAEAQRAALDALRRREGILAARRDRLAAEARAAERNAELRIDERRALDAARAAEARAEAVVLRARAVRDESALRLERMTIRAPITGYVQRRLKVPGDKVMLGMDDPHSSHIVHLYDPERLQVRVDIPLADAARVFVGQSCEVVVEVLPDRTFAGEVTRVTHEADLQKNTLQAKVRVIDPSPALRPEMLTRVKFLAGQPLASPGGPAAADAPSATTAAVLVPESAIDRAPAGARVWVVRDRRAETGRLDPEPVEADADAAPEGWARLTGGVRPGDLLALAPPGGWGDFRPGQRVRIQRDNQQPARIARAEIQGGAP